MSRGSNARLVKRIRLDNKRFEPCFGIPNEIQYLHLAIEKATPVPGLHPYGGPDLKTKLPFFFPKFITFLT
jgi:hypothetical protein